MNYVLRYFKYLGLRFLQETDTEKSNSKSATQMDEVDIQGGSIILDLSYFNTAARVVT